MSKRCTKCKQTKPINEFSPKGIRVDGSQKYSSHCKKCCRETKKEKYDPHKRWIKLIKGFNLTEEDYQNLLDKQKGSCAICGSEDFKLSHKGRPHVDHCHNTGKVRGLLCGSCNVGLGHFKDSPDILAKAIEYLTPSQQ